jgi:hypothetical protein
VDNRSPVGGADRVCRRLRELGAERPFLLATGIGTGEVPGPDEAEWWVVEVRAPDVVAEIRAAMRLLRLLPDEVVDALDRWGPERQALVLSPMFNELPQIAGRRVYGPRRPSGGGAFCLRWSATSRTRPRRRPSWPPAATGCG